MRELKLSDQTIEHLKWSIENDQPFPKHLAAMAVDDIATLKDALDQEKQERHTLSEFLRMTNEAGIQMLEQIKEALGEDDKVLITLPESVKALREHCDALRAELSALRGPRAFAAAECTAKTLSDAKRDIRASVNVLASTPAFPAGKSDDAALTALRTDLLRLLDGEFDAVTIKRHHARAILAALAQVVRQPAETALPCAACGAEAGMVHGIRCNQPSQIYQEGADATFQPEKLPTTCNEPRRTDKAPAGRDFEIPRRVQMQLWTPAEKAIFDAMQAVEITGASIALTDAVTFLQQARDRVADHVEGINRNVSLTVTIDETVSISTPNLSAKEQD